MKLSSLVQEGIRTKLLKGSPIDIITGPPATLF
jgi:hypothetical protein